MLLIIKSVREDKPGRQWQQLFDAYWPAYKSWFLSEGHLARPGYITSRKNLRQHMPELLPIYNQLVDLAGGGDLAARFLTLYCPPPYLAGCSQAIWPGRPPFLIRNYDYDPRLFEGLLLYSSWRRPVIAMSDCMWGVLDGMNDAGLTVSLAFGGRKITGKGFGVPLILRYILEICDTTAEASEILKRVPVHMPYNVSVIDQKGQYLTVFLSPDRPALISTARAVTNHQDKVEWEDYIRITSSVERREFLEKRLTDAKETSKKFIDRFLVPPLYNTQFEKAFGTLYTATYTPQSLEAVFYWPSQKLRQTFSEFSEEKLVINLKLFPSSFKKRSIS